MLLYGSNLCYINLLVEVNYLFIFIFKGVGKCDFSICLGGEENGYISE